MSEDTEQVGNSDSGGDSQSSQEGSQQSPDLATLQKQVETLTKMFQGIQKGNDKVNARVEQRVNEALSTGQIGRIAELAKSGKSSEEIENQLLLEEILAERKGKVSGAQSQGREERAGGGSEAQPDIFTETVKAFGLDANDKDVAEAISKKDIAGLAKLGASKLAAPESDSSTQPPLNAKQRVDGNKEKQIIQEYETRLAKIPRGNTHAVSTLKAEIRKKAREAGFIINL